jgi:hypothetical protein
LRIVPVGDDLFPIIDDTELCCSIARFIQRMLIGSSDAEIG